MTMEGLSRRMGLLAAMMVVAGCAAPRTATLALATDATEWPAYGGDAGGGRWSPLDQINRGNVADLRVAWTYHTGETRPEYATAKPTALEATPLMVDGTVYLSTPLGRVMALDPETGAERWVFDPRIDRSVRYGDFVNRGVSTWVDGRAADGAACRRTIIVATIDARLIALDARDGQPCRAFGEAGTVDLRRGLRNPPFEAAEYEETSPPAVIGDVIVVGSAIADNNRTDAASGEVRGFDARTGAQLWAWDPVPQDPADPAYASWGSAEARRTGAANAWSVIAADPERGLVFVPTSSPSPDYFGGARPGDNRYANSIVALSARTGQVVWHFQTVHHDLWDYDNASPPALVTLHRDGRPVPAVIQATKTGQMFVLHRETGEPLFPVVERPVPASTVPGESAWPTQPFSTLPPLSPHALGEVWGPNDAERDACRATVAGLRNEGIFTPPSLEGTLAVPSNIGGAHWGGVAFDRADEVAIVPVNRIASIVRLIPREQFRSERQRDPAARASAGWETTDMRGTPYVMQRRLLLGPGGAPCTPPPFGALVAISLRTGQKVWDVPLGAPGPLGASLPNGGEGMGSPNLGGPIATAGGLVFMAGTLDHFLRAFDVQTGQELWRGALPAGGKATPMTYRWKGRQYVLVAAGGDGGAFGRGDAIVAFALPSGR